MVDTELGYTPTPALSHAILTYNRGAQGRPGRRHRDHAVAQSRPTMAASNTTRPTAVRPTPTAPSGFEDRANAILGRRPARSAARRPTARRSGRHHPSPRLTSRSTSTTWAQWSTSMPMRDARPVAGRRSAGRRGRGLLGTHRRAVRADDGGRRYDRRPDLPLHARRLGRQDPHGLLVALRHGGPDRDARTDSMSPSPATPTTTATAS